MLVLSLLFRSSSSFFTLGFKLVRIVWGACRSSVQSRVTESTLLSASFSSCQVCREQFVALHSQPVLKELSNFLLQKYCAVPWVYTPACKKTFDCTHARVWIFLWYRQTLSYTKHAAPTCSNVVNQSKHNIHIRDCRNYIMGVFPQLFCDMIWNDVLSLSTFICLSLLRVGYPYHLIAFFSFWDNWTLCLQTLLLGCQHHLCLSTSHTHTDTFLFPKPHKHIIHSSRHQREGHGPLQRHVWLFH